MRRHLLIASFVLALLVVPLGAWVRATDAGLGCPDWPGCYGRATPALAAADIARAEAAQPDGPVSQGKAWREMVHRYAAGALGMAILALAVSAWRGPRRPGRTPRLETALLLTVVFQALLGMWTVTRLLQPLVVTAHLLGGMGTLALLAALLARERMPCATEPRGIRRRLRVALGLLLLQVALGGWVSSNHAALACTGFPACNGDWWPEMDFPAGFRLLRESGDWPGLPALTAVHWAHRLGALAAFVALVVAAAPLLRRPAWRDFGIVLLMLGTVQVIFGVANVLAARPLPLAVAHNLVAALLLVALSAALSRRTLSLRLAASATRRTG